jgi:hypothetical protein
MNKAKIFLMILIVGAMTQYAFSEDANVFHPGGVIISAEYQSILPSCNSYPHLKYPQGIFEYCIWKNVSLESSIFQNFRISGNSVKGIMGIGLVWIPNLKTVSIKPTLGIRFLIARRVAIHAKIFYLKTSDMDIGLGFAYGLGFALK